METTERFEGEVTVRRTRFASPESGWAVLDAAEADGSQVVLVGPLAHLEDRERARVVGTWVDDSRYGLQVKVAEALPLPPADRETVVALLRRIKHVGAKRAQAIAARHAVGDVLGALDRDPRGELEAVGLRGARAREAAEAWEGLRASRRLHLLLAPHGLAYLVARVQEEFGDQAHQVVQERPYELTALFGVGFALADRIALGCGGPIDPRQRARAGALHLLAEGERSGSSCQPRPALADALSDLLGQPAPEGLLEEMERRGELVLIGPWVYRRATAELEAELAERVAELLAQPPAEKLAALASDEAAELPAELTAEQRQGLCHALAHRLSVITGGPGTGKTASIRTIAAVALEGGAKVMLVAPTGRAAVRMTEASGVRARTVHSALGWVPGEGPSHDEEDPLPCDLLVLDESSMANLELLVTLLRAVGSRTHVVLVGDADQLAPVGAGKPFADLVAAAQVPVVRLTHIFRQAAGSMIVQGAHAVRQGRVPSFAPGEGMRRDLFLLSRPDPAAAREEIVTLVSERLPRHYEVDPVSDIQVFAPVYRGDLGIDTLNTALQRALNPAGAPVRGGRLRIGDKVMMTGRNLHELGLMNGTLLRLLDETPAEEDDAALVLGSEEAVFRLPPEEGERLRLAYACSVHRGQGIELPVAIIVAHPAAGAFFLRREMLYTALTRARLATVVVGTPEVVARAVRATDTGRRHSRLGERLQELL